MIVSKCVAGWRLGNQPHESRKERVSFVCKVAETLSDFPCRVWTDRAPETSFFSSRIVWKLFELKKLKIDFFLVRFKFLEYLLYFFRAEKKRTRCVSARCARFSRATTILCQYSERKAVKSARQTVILNVDLWNAVMLWVLVFGARFLILSLTFVANRETKARRLPLFLFFRQLPCRLPEHVAVAEPDLPNVQGSRHRRLRVPRFEEQSVVRNCCQKETTLRSNKNLLQSWTVCDWRERGVAADIVGSLTRSDLNCPGSCSFVDGGRGSNSLITSPAWTSWPWFTGPCLAR